MAQIKGFAIRGILKWIKTSGYPGGIPKIIEKLPADVSPTFAKQITSSMWYPYGSFAALLRTVDKEIGRGDLSLMPKLGKAAAHEDIGSIFKLLLSLTSLETVIKRSPILWQKYCDTGKVEVLDAKAGLVRTAMVEFPGMERAHCELIVGWSEELGRLCGAKDIKMSQPECVHRGGKRCVWEGKFT